MGFVKSTNHIGCPAAVAGAGTNSLLVRTFPTVVPSVGFAVYVSTVAVAEALFVSINTSVASTDVPALFAVDRLIKNALIVPAVVCVPASHARSTRMVFDALPVIVATSVAEATEAKAADDAV